MPVDPDVEDRFQKFIAEPPSARRQPKTEEERAALAWLMAQQSRLQPSGGFADTVSKDQPMPNAGASNMSIQPGKKAK